jgi:ferrous iron transport protein B
MTISLLEDSGYMSRVAVIMDKWMGKIGLSGKSFMPMILGFGCTVPAVMGARIIENKFERLATIMGIPFMSCGARLPVYLLIISAFVPLKFQAVVLLLVYATGVFFAAVSAKILRLTIFKGEENPLIIELPKYSTPSLKSVWMLTWHRGKHFLEKAGTIILFASIVLWVLNTFPRIDTEELTGMSENDAALLKAENSFSGRIGKAIEPAFKIMDADWKVASSFLASLAAKELFVSQMSILHAMGNEDENSAALQNKFKEEYSLATAIAIILFILLSAPCVATFAGVKVETDSWFWPTVQYAGMIIIAYFAALGRIFHF